MDLEDYIRFQYKKVINTLTIRITLSPAYDEHLVTTNILVSRIM